MKPKLGLTLAVLALLVAAPLTSVAQPRDRGHDRGWHGDIRHFENRDMQHWRSGTWRHGSHGGRLGWWWVIGGLWYFYPQPVYPYPDPYRPPLIVEQAPPVIVQVPAPAPGPQPAPAMPPVASQPAAQYWYYCEVARGYYPYVASCPSGWKTVPATPAGVQP
jgi:hypothetical protein